MYERMISPINIPNGSPFFDFHRHGKNMHATKMFITMTLFKKLGVLT